MKQTSSIIVTFAIFGIMFGILSQQAFAEGITTDYVEFNAWIYPAEEKSRIDFVTATYEYISSTYETETILHHTEHVLLTTDDEKIVQYIVDKTGLYHDEIRNILSIQVDSTQDCDPSTVGDYCYEVKCYDATDKPIPCSTASGEDVKCYDATDKPIPCSTASGEDVKCYDTATFDCYDTDGNKVQLIDDNAYFAIDNYDVTPLNNENTIQRITDLENENKHLKETNAKLEQRIQDLENIVMEQIRTMMDNFKIFISK